MTIPYRTKEILAPQFWPPTDTLIIAPTHNPMISWANIMSQTLRGGSRKAIDAVPGEALDLAVSACVNYWSGSINRRHETRTLFTMERTDEPELYDRRRMRVSESDLSFRPFELGSQAY